MTCSPLTGQVSSPPKAARGGGLSAVWDYESPGFQILCEGAGTGLECIIAVL